MNRATVAVGLTTFYVLAYAMTPDLGVAYDIVFALFVIGNFLLIYMVYAILRHADEPKGKWSDGDWYQDMGRQYSKDC